MLNRVSYRTVKIGGLSIFYREAGPKDRPTILLLHGLPSSSRMFEPLFARLSDRYHLVAPDYPGFGHSEWPDPKTILLYVRSIYAESHRWIHTSDRPRALHTLHAGLWRAGRVPHGARASESNRGAHCPGRSGAQRRARSELGSTRRAFWADRAANESTLRTRICCRWCNYAERAMSANDPNVERYDPDLWTDEFAFLSQPGQGDIQSDLFYDYRTNVAAYPKWQAWMRRTAAAAPGDLGQIWPFVRTLGEPEAYRRDVPKG